MMTMGDITMPPVSPNTLEARAAVRGGATPPGPSSPLDPNFAVQPGAPAAKMVQDLKDRGFTAADIKPGETLDAAYTRLMTPKNSAEGKALAKSFYDTADASNGTVQPSLINRVIDDQLSTTLKPTPATEGLKTSTAVDDVTNWLQSRRDKPLSVSDVDAIDKKLGDYVNADYAANRGLSSDGQKVLTVQRALRDAIDNAQPGDIGGGQEGFDALSNARRAWSQARKMEDIENIQKRADATSNPEASYKNQINALLNNAKRSRGYDPDEIAALEKARDRGMISTVMHDLGNHMVASIASGATAGVAGFLGGGPIGLGAGVWGAL
jgi:hypothetical protein